jgi:hypothetical protein
MDNIYYSGLTVNEAINLKGDRIPRVCYLCKRKEGDVSYGVIKEQNNEKMFYNKHVLQLGELQRPLGMGHTAVYLLCTECAFLLQVADELIYDDNVKELNS